MPFESQYFLLLIYLWSLLKNFSASCLLLITRHVNKTGLIIPREFYMNARIYASMRCKHPFYGKPSPPLTLSVLYLSRPCLTFSAWIWSITVVAFVSFRSPSWFLSSWKRNVLQSCIKIFKVFRGLISIQAHYSTPQAKTTVCIPSPFSQKHPFSFDKEDLHPAIFFHDLSFCCLCGSFSRHHVAYVKHQPAFLEVGYGRCRSREVTC